MCGVKETILCSFNATVPKIPYIRSTPSVPFYRNNLQKITGIKKGV